MMFDPTAVYAPQTSAGAVAAVPYSPGYAQAVPYMPAVISSQPAAEAEATWGFSEVAMLAVGGAVLGAALSQRAKGNGRAAAGSDLEAALPADFARVAAPAFTARAPEVEMFGSFGGGAKKAAAAKPAAKKGAKPVAKKAARPVAKKAAKPVAKGKAAPAAADARPVRGDLSVANPDPKFRSQRFATGDIGVTPPLGVYDPLGLTQTRDMRRYEIMEIKHGRAAMFGFLHIVLIHAGVRLPGYLSYVNDLKFADMPVGCFESLEATPTLGWLQIMAVTCAAETGYLGTTAGVTKQLDSKAPGDIGGSGWKRYADPEERAFKLNAERNNGRAAMLGVTGCLIHELLGVDALYPTGGLAGAAPPPIFT
jgi:hypothetical protein